MVIATPPAPTAPAAPGGSTGARPAGRRRPGEFGGGGRKFTPRRKVCQFCVDKIKEVDYKDLGRLRRFLSERGKIEPRRKTGTCAAHQRSLNVALKRARHLALLPFTAEHIRVTGVPVREPGSSLRGPRPRPEGFEPEAEAAAPEAAAPAPEAPAPEAQAAPDGVHTSPGETPPATSSPETVAQSSAAQGMRETPASGPTQPSTPQTES